MAGGIRQCEPLYFIKETISYGALIEISILQDSGQTSREEDVILSNQNINSNSKM